MTKLPIFVTAMLIVVSGTGRSRTGCEAFLFSSEETATDEAVEAVAADAETDVVLEQPLQHVQDEAENNLVNQPEEHAPSETKLPAKTFSAALRSGRQILVLGGNGFLGASTVARLVELDDSVTIVNRGNWYWDSKDRITPRVQTISCDRNNGIESCDELVQLVADVDTFDAVIDFSAYGPRHVNDVISLLTRRRRNESDSQSAANAKSESFRTKLYVLISTDSVYDVCDPAVHTSGPLREDHAVRPSDPYQRDQLADHHDYGHRKLEAEELLVKRRESAKSKTSDVDSINGLEIPYVILRLPDVIGPRDTTHRFWMYQLWIRMTAALPGRRPVVIPDFLDGYNNSFVYADDVARTIVELVDTFSSKSISGSDTSTSSKAKQESILHQIFNLAWIQNITLGQLLHDIDTAVFKNTPDVGDADARKAFTNGSSDDASSANLYLYPSVRRGPIDSSKATKLLGWRPTPWTEAVHTTVEFYEGAMKDPKWRTQSDEIIQIVAAQLFNDDREVFYKAVEKSYGISLEHFRPRHSEL